MPVHTLPGSPVNVDKYIVNPAVCCSSGVTLKPTDSSCALPLTECNTSAPPLVPLGARIVEYVVAQGEVREVDALLRLMERIEEEG